MIEKLRYYITDSHHRMERIISPQSMIEEPSNALVEQYKSVRSEWDKYVVMLCDEIDKFGLLNPRYERKEQDINKL